MREHARSPIALLAIPQLVGVIVTLPLLIPAAIVWNARECGTRYTFCKAERTFVVAQP